MNTRVENIESIKKEIIKEITKKRKELNLTQNYIEGELSIEIGCLSRFENGKRNPKLETLFKITDFLGINVEIKIN